MVRARARDRPAAGGRNPVDDLRAHIEHRGGSLRLGRPRDLDPGRRLHRPHVHIRDPRLLVRRKRRYSAKILISASI